MICKEIKSLKEMEALGEKMGAVLRPGKILCLKGDLGAGKTTLTQALARGLEVTDYVTSPTFTIIHQYEGRLPLYHFDVYRINHFTEMEDIGYEDYFYGEGVCVIEWATLIEEILPEDCLWIEIRVVGVQERQICFYPANEEDLQMIEELLKS
ncbi:protein of unknown function UPF0079 [Alkaliphilus metalliredigens QYMF]|uniref:tRNA threonylcarbamoyladenosine biosynthesis protein TsaE n=1 Tax=Alkaliphilus metalliredigens (strain QYMF) TaxID=293826 RepID=A6TLG0_ALKMQ|nr:tRNA (adenosine(37)-N6)-threonylcarbamoyltransferase complex ATPase subunit type 1 TsaE [Alkaliphilus metalliredigens]ABR47028.1 protein of unknown function UPF0079 [Alkaliphilus metalliredigens QYMF]